MFFCLSCNQLQPTFCATRYQRHFPQTFICIFCIIVKWANNWHNVHERPTKLKANAEVRVESGKWNVLRTAQRKHCMFQANINRILLYKISMKLSLLYNAYLGINWSNKRERFQVIKVKIKWGISETHLFKKISQRKLV